MNNFTVPKGKTLKVTDPYVSPEHKEILGRAQEQLSEYEEHLLHRLKCAYPAAISVKHKGSMHKITRLYQGDPLRMKMIESIGALRMCYERPRLIIVDEVVSENR